jgi:AraC-like DNA-binding protein
LNYTSLIFTFFAQTPFDLYEWQNNTKTSMASLLLSITCGFYFLLAFIVAINFRQVNIKANYWLAFFLFSIGFMLVDTPLETLGVYKVYPILAVFTNIFVFTIAPSLFLSISYFVTPSLSFRRRDLWHFFPPFLLFFLNLPFYIESLTCSADQYIEPTDAETKVNMICGTIILIIPFMVYWFLCFRKLTRHQAHIQLYSASTEAISLFWLRNMMYSLALLILCLSCEILRIFPSIAEISPVFYAICTYYVAYHIMRQAAIFPVGQHQSIEIQEILVESNKILAERKQILSIDELTELKVKLTTIMTKEKPYLDSTLSLSKLAGVLQISPHELSYLINVGFDENFFGLINTHRVEESKMMLRSVHHHHLSMVGIAYEAGFNSKTAFNIAFKKQVGMTPTEFQKLKTPDIT